MEILILVILILIVLALVLYLIDLLPLQGTIIKDILKVLCILIAILLIIQKTGLL